MGILNWFKKLLTGEAQPSDTPPHPTVPRPDSAAPVAPPRPTAPEPPRWIPPGQSLHIGPYLLPDGLFYVGDTLGGVSAQVSIEPALIRPQLKIDPEHRDADGVWMTPWPSYSEIPSGCRAAYLEWLSQGRTNAAISIHYVYLFFYGLERRVLQELRVAPTDISAELTPIIDELNRLIACYGQHEAFVRDATALLDVCWTLQSPHELNTHAPCYDPNLDGIPPSVWVNLGRFAATQMPLSAEWALLWYLYAPSTKLRTIAQRCLPELPSLFRLRYNERCPQGLTIPPRPQAPFRFTYQPASVSFGGPIELEVNEYADVFAPANSWPDLLPEMVQLCLTELAPYGRWLGRNPDGRGSYGAVLLLPRAIATQHENATVRTMRAWLTEHLPPPSRWMGSGAEFLKQWAGHPSPPDKLTKAEAVILSQYLARLDIGIEPDVRYGGKPITAHRPVVLFRGASPEDPQPSTDYALMQLRLQLAAMVVQAPESCCTAGQAYVTSELASHQPLWESQRLQAQFAGLCQEKLTLRGLKKRFADVSPVDKSAIAAFLLRVAQAPGDPTPAAITLLTKLYPLLDHDADQVYSDLYQTSPAPPDAAQPPPADAPAAPPLASPLNLNPNLIQQRQHESAAAADLLADIFADPEQPDLARTKDPVSPSTPPGCIGDLDQAHSHLLRTLSQQTSWPRTDLETIATDLGLLLDGALENLNDLAFDQCDEPLIEGEDPIEVDAEILATLLA